MYIYTSTCHMYTFSTEFAKCYLAHLTFDQNVYLICDNECCNVN